MSARRREGLLIGSLGMVVGVVLAIYNVEHGISAMSFPLAFVAVNAYMVYRHWRSR